MQGQTRLSTTYTWMTREEWNPIRFGWIISLHADKYRIFGISFGHVACNPTALLVTTHCKDHAREVRIQAHCTHLTLIFTRIDKYNLHHDLFHIALWRLGTARRRSSAREATSLHYSEYMASYIGKHQFVSRSTSPVFSLNMCVRLMHWDPWDLKLKYADL